MNDNEMHMLFATATYHFQLLQRRHLPEDSSGKAIQPRFNFVVPVGYNAERVARILVAPADLVPILVECRLLQREFHGLLVNAGRDSKFS